MKNCITIFFLSLLFINCHSKNKIAWVFDFEHDLTQLQINKLDSLYKSHEKKTSNEIALVTKSDYYPDSTILMFAVNFGRVYGIGKKETDNGIVIVFNGRRHEARISTGYGTEKVLKDEIAKSILDSIMIPRFKNDETFEGLWEGSLALINFLEKKENKIRAR
jgi:uncharacterized protein